MRVAIIGRSEMLYNVMTALYKAGHDICLIVTAKEAPEYKIKALDFEKYANENNIKYIYSPNVNFDKILGVTSDIPQMDLAVSINYTGIISSKVINLFKIGVLNMHAGDLPKYRGNAVVAWAMLNKETRIINCIHKMIGGELDNGDILLKDSFPINNGTKINNVFEWLEERAPFLFLEVLSQLSKNPEYILEKQSKRPEEALRCYPRKPEDGEINWSNSSSEILTLINASSEPFGGAYSTYKNEKIVIWNAEIVKDNEVFLAVPGQVIKVNEDSFEVAAADGKLRINEVTYKNERKNAKNIIVSLRDRLK